MDPNADQLVAHEAALEAARKARDDARDAAREAREALAVEAARFLRLDPDECRAICNEMDVDDFKAFGEDIAGTKRDLRFLELKVKRGAVVGSRTRIVASRWRTRTRSSHARRPGHRRTRSSTRAGPSDDPDPPREHEPAAPRLTLAPKPTAIYAYAVLTAEQRGEGS